MITFCANIDSDKGSGLELSECGCPALSTSCVNEGPGRKNRRASKTRHLIPAIELEAALINQGTATPVNRSQNMNEFLGGVKGSVIPGSPDQSGYGGQNIAQTYWDPWMQSEMLSPNIIRG